MPHIGVILSGCGVFDGSEIHEAVLTLLSLDQRGAKYTCLAPVKTFPVVNHVTREQTTEERDVLVEAARIARGEIKPLSEISGADFDGYILPGGFGAAKNLCSFAFEGGDCVADPQTERVLTEAHTAGRPIGFACIAPAVAARVLGPHHPQLTVGNDAETGAALEQMGAKFVPTDVTEIVADESQHIVSTPAYMEPVGIAQVQVGIDKMVEKVLEWTRQTAVV
ncbi:isoprenoid biosynthesis glyoxalase ElbB [Calycomorphotria hydatis]|uniref:Enhancing lycopene biosynthesis protein 2 n=1 Tax=Calycomorphotria hydatis TaxID=2528027 RepID=A0A517T924_9PLAN|nr:isoprenoid biosynthesis glyoxalase ElbB [Calycomorphotria hydatis]QDT64863.1 Enhancing lycopene biosynthesis protein 2 [Calycomorphotria hydatis]